MRLNRIQALIDNQLVAQLLFNHRLATREQILACWPHITPELDLGILLVDQGILPPETYRDLLAYLQTQVVGNPGTPPVPPRRKEPASGSGRMASPTRESYAPSASYRNSRDHADLHPSESETLPPSREREENWTPAPLYDTPASVSGAPTVVSGTPAAVSGAQTPAPGTPVPAHPQRRTPSAAPAVPKEIGPHSTWDELLVFARHYEVTDLHLSPGNPILVRRFGGLQRASAEPLRHEVIKAWVESALDPDQLRSFESRGDLELMYPLEGAGRYRVSLMRQRAGWDITARVIPARIRSFEEAGLPEACRELLQWAQGLVLITGPVGCGKSGTLATLVDIVNQNRRDHIITIENPIEFIFEPKGCRITQRQISEHTASREAALRAALREDPDIIVIAELRDLDTIQLAVSAAETGHLVFATMNTTSATRTIHRLIDSFPPEEQPIVRNMVSESLRGVISQQLLPLKDGSGMVPAYELMIINSAVANLIRKDEAHQLGTAMITGKSSGMVLLDDSLRSLVEKGLVEPEEAYARAVNPKDFEKYLGRAGR